MGTANYLISLGHGMYLELIGPTPGTKPQALGVALSQLESPELFWFAIRSSWIDDAPAVFQALGLQSKPPIPGNRTSADGDIISWRLAEVTGHPFGGCMPFLIDWQDSTHPSASTRQSLQFGCFEISHPIADGLNAVFECIGLPIQATAGEPQLSLSLVGPRGSLELTGSGVMSCFDQDSFGVFG